MGLADNLVSESTASDGFQILVESTGHSNMARAMLCEMWASGLPQEAGVTSFTIALFHTLFSLEGRDLVMLTLLNSLLCNIYVHIS